MGRLLLAKKETSLIYLDLLIQERGKQREIASKKKKREGKKDSRLSIPLGKRKTRG